MFKAWCKHQYGNKTLQHRIFWNTKTREWQTGDKKKPESIKMDMMSYRQFCFMAPNKKHDPMEEPDSGVEKEQEATIQKLKERLLYWADEIEDDSGRDFGKDFERAIEEMRYTAEQL